MNIAGMQLNVPSINWMGTIAKFSMWTLIVIIILALGFWLFTSAKNKKIYKYPVTLRVRRDNGTKSRYDLKGGLTTGKNGIKTFKIKIPGVLKKFDLGYIPDFSLAGMDDRLSFLQEGDAQLWQQTKEELITEKIVVNDKGEQVGVFKLLVEPIPTDTKTATFNNLQQTRDLLDAKKLTAWGITIGGFIIMVIAHLISLWIQTKIKCSIP